METRQPLYLHPPLSQQHNYIWFHLLDYNADASFNLLIVEQRLLGPVWLWEYKNGNMNTYPRILILELKMGLRIAILVWFTQNLMWNSWTRKIMFSKIKKLE